LRWTGSYLNFTLMALVSWLLGWLPGFTRWIQPWLEPRFPRLWFWLLTQSYGLTYGVGKPRADFVRIRGRAASTDVKISPSLPESMIRSNQVETK
jgi:lycopene cyclase CruA